MCANGVVIVSRIGRILHIKAGLAGDGVPLDSSDELSALARKHRPNDELERTSEERFEVLAGGDLLVHREVLVQPKVVSFGQRPVDEG